jgi:hypothetical protein
LSGSAARVHGDERSGRALALLGAKRARTSSLPVPDSPVTSTLASDGAARAINS